MDLTQPLSDYDLMPFGAHKGKRMIDVPDSYLIWCSKQGFVEEEYPEVWDYIEDNWDAINSKY